MPELPEVEVIRRSLEPYVVGRCVTDIVVRETRLRRPVPARRMRHALVGASVRALARRAKYLVFHLGRAPGGVASDTLLVIHLGMSGRLWITAAGAPAEPHEHLVFRLSPAGGRPAEDLRFRDPRRFGLVELLPADAWERTVLFHHLGPEPLDPATDAHYLYDASRRRKSPVKNFLMDVRVLVGVGNIYASEALYRARVDPRTPAGRIGLARWQRILGAVRSVLETSIVDGGTSLVDFRDGEGNRGLHQVRLAVYGCAGRPCGTCGRRIRREVLAGRSTYFCTHCQR